MRAALQSITQSAINRDHLESKLKELVRDTAARRGMKPLEDTGLLEDGIEYLAEEVHTLLNMIEKYDQNGDTEDGTM